MDHLPEIEHYIQLEIETLQKLDRHAIAKAIAVLDRVRLDGGTVYTFGNGGSAATASHFQNDFNKGLSEHLDPKFTFVCLADNTATVMAIANDFGYEDIFWRQMDGRIGPQDAVLAISGSGNSINVVKGAEHAKATGASVIGLTGYDGGRLAAISDVSLHAPINSLQVSEDIHMVLDHLMMAVLYKKLCGVMHLQEE